MKPTTKVKFDKMDYFLIFDAAILTILAFMWLGKAVFIGIHDKTDPNDIIYMLAGIQCLLMAIGTIIFMVVFKILEKLYE